MTNLIQEIQALQEALREAYHDLGETRSELARKDAELENLRKLTGRKG